MAGIAADPVVRLLLTGVACLVPTLAFLGLLRLLDRLRNDVLIEHTMRMAAEDGATAEDAVLRMDPTAAVDDARSRASASPARTPAAEERDGDGPRRAPGLVLCSACATLRSSRPGACPMCGASLDEAADRSVADGGLRDS
ncbi:hypothetical protein [Halobaculum rubrum]|uniref:hypothetical protein n=1 Tax=Halobaculum rubrum TaxID=2872158 RepID=UPI001CA399EA|nr:hypothetical protein [Halobaculum rubrum]QZY00190.1 hypothetical protein K6T25_03530 [Halobaculum rubrum]